MGRGPTYYCNSDGTWMATVWKPQCPEKHYLDQKCQGIEGHDKEHWTYQPSGLYDWWYKNTDPEYHRRRAVAGTIPPGSSQYVNPIDKFQEYYGNHYHEEEVTDPEILAALQRREVPDVEGATVMGAPSDEDMAWLNNNGRLDEILARCNNLDNEPEDT